MTSVSVKKPIDGLILSNTIRIGVVGLAKTLPNEPAPCNITVNNVRLAYTLTQRVQKLSVYFAAKKGITPEEAIRSGKSRIARGRLGKLDEVAATVTFFASVRAGFMTGYSIRIDDEYCKGVM